MDRAPSRSPVKAKTAPHNRGQELTARELRLLERYYGRIPRKDLAARYLPERTLKGIEHRARLLGLTRRRAKPTALWTKVEVELLKRHHGKMSIAEINARYLPDRTPDGIEHRARLLGLTRPRAPVYSWKSEDLELLRRHYGAIPNHELRDRDLPQVSIQAIRHKARRLGLRSKEPDWSAEENRLLRRYYGRISNPELVRRHLPRRTADTVQGHAAKLGLMRQAFDTWTAKELRLLSKHYPNHTLAELARYFPGRTAAAIRTRVRMEGLQKSAPPLRWTKRELALIQRHYEAKDGLDTLVRVLDRTRLSIQQQARKLGLSRAGNPWTAGDDALLRRLNPVHGRHSRIPGHTPGSIRERARKLGLRR